jgi:predicted metal-binding protein
VGDCPGVAAALKKIEPNHANETEFHRRERALTRRVCGICSSKRVRMAMKEDRMIKQRSLRKDWPMLGGAYIYITPRLGVLIAL